MKKVYILMTQWKDGDPEVAGVFSSFDKAVSYFVRDKLKDTTMPVDKMQSEITQVALKMAHMTDDNDYADFGDVRAWIEDRLIDGLCAAWEKGGEAVVDIGTGVGDKDYVAQEPCFLETKEDGGGQGMIHLSWHEIKNLIDAVERARSDMGRGFFWYYLQPDGILVRDPGLTDTGYSNLVDHVRRRIDAKRWHVAPDGDNGLKIEAKEEE